MGTCSRQSAEHQLISEMKARLAIFVLVLFIVYCPASTEGPCCDIQVVSGQGSVDGIYTLTRNPTMAVDEVCLDSCVYTKFGEEDEYCFKGANIPGTTECSVLTTDSFTSGTTVVPSAEDLSNEKDALEEDLEKDKEELASLEAEEESASAVDAEIDGVEAKIEQLTQTSDDETTDGVRVKRQAATSCVEVGTIVDEMTRERETAKKLVLIRKITMSTILSCTSEDDKQFLVVAKTTLKEKIKMVKETNSENMTVIRQTILKVKVKIVTKEKKIENILAKLEAIENQTTTSVPTTNQPTTNQPTTKQPTTIQPTTNQITSNQPTTNQQTTNQPTTNWPTTSLPTTKKPTTSQPTTNQPTTKEATKEPSTNGETPKPMTTTTTNQPTTNQPTTSQPTRKQPTTNQPTTNQPTTN